MIKTTEPVGYDLVDLTQKKIVFAQVTSVNRNDINESYVVNTEEWIETTYSENVPNPEAEGGMEIQTFTKKEIVRIPPPRTVSFAEADGMEALIDSMGIVVTETGCARRKKYFAIGHWLINQGENIRNVNWEFV